MRKLIVAAFLIAACVTDGSGLSYGEHLIQNLPSADRGWTGYSKQEGDHRRFMWKDSSGEVVMYVTILPGKSGEPHEVLYQSDVDSGPKFCSEQTTERIDTQPKYGYPMLLWYTKCQLKAGGSRFILSKVASGRDSLYFIQRIWNEPPDEADLTRWRDAFAAAHICDTRRSDAPCPTDLGVKKPGLDF